MKIIVAPRHIRWSEVTAEEFIGEYQSSRGVQGTACIPNESQRLPYQLAAASDSFAVVSLQSEGDIYPSFPQLSCIVKAAKT